MQRAYLTKSDFKAAQSCSTKLYYRKLGYPTREDRDEHLAALVDQGYLVEALARAVYPEGRWIGYREDVEAATWDTMAAISAAPHCTLFETTFISGNKLARVDILVKRENVLELIEVKSCGFDRQQHEELSRTTGMNLFRTDRAPGIRASWLPYVEDAAFQLSILQDVFPGETIVPYLLMPDTSRVCLLDGLHHQFALRTLSSQLENDRPPAADYTGDPRELRRNLFLARVNILEEVELVLADVRRRADELAATLAPLRRQRQPISVHCAHCEYRVTSGDRRGFHECWGDLANVEPHILDLYHVGGLGGRKRPLANDLITAGKASLLDIPERRVTRGDGQVGQVTQRQRVQIRQTRAVQEWLSNTLGEVIGAMSYPLRFVDFETCAPPIPRYRGMRPFERIAYQWCCQTIAAPDVPPLHGEWIQTSDTFPNFAFAAALRRELGDEGSVLVWGNHEAAVLQAIRRQMAEHGETDSEVYRWLEDFLDGGRLVDMNRLTLNHYFHPHMAGRTTLKVVADAVWQADASIRGRLPQYAQDATGTLSSPYAALPPLSVGGRTVSVTDGLGAVLAYYSMMERAAAGATLEADRWRQLLRQYCKLDTLAMVMVWWRWESLTRGERAA